MRIILIYIPTGRLTMIHIFSVENLLEILAFLKAILCIAKGVSFTTWNISRHKIVLKDFLSRLFQMNSFDKFKKQTTLWVLFFFTIPNVPSKLFFSRGQCKLIKEMKDCFLWLKSFGTNKEFFTSRALFLYLLSYTPMKNHIYSPSQEAYWQKFWLDNNIYTFEKNSKKPIYSIDTPPPTISGQIHIGHIFSYTQAEVIARYRRMDGQSLYYPFWFDDNGLPTEKLVEKEIGTVASELPREDFNAHCLRISEQYREQFQTLWQSMWFSVDWNLKYSTISPEVQKASQTSFCQLLKKGLIYQKKSPTLWCCGCQTAIAQADTERQTFASIFYDLAFQLEDSSTLCISTTRPELLPACVGVLVHGEDARYQHLIGKSVMSPLWTKVPILWDDKVDPQKGSGAVMCCTYGDETDMYWVKKYHLPEKMILDQAGNMQATWNPKLDGVYYKKARKMLVEELQNAQKILSFRDIEHEVSTHDRCKTPIEIQSVQQWFVKTLENKEIFIELGSQIRWNPAFMEKRYKEWVENLKWDWCISRQRYFWIPIPVWYSKKTWELILPELSDLPINPLTDLPKNLPAWHTKEDIVPDTDVLDTWATSSLTPLINARFFETDEEKRQILPMDLRPQAHDIIRTWAFYSIIMSYYHTWTLPFSNIMISGHVLAPKGEKISKSKNNAGTTPEELLKKYGADPVRYWACSWTLGKDIVFDEKEIEKGRKLQTKLWNATQYALLNLWNFDPKEPRNEALLENIDAWILKKSNVLSQKMRKSLDGLNIANAIWEFESFFWSDFCDNYLEIVKGKLLQTESENFEAQKRSAQYGLYHSLFNILKLIAPVLPHITEELYQSYYRSFENEISIHLLLYPTLSEPHEEFEKLDEEIKMLFEIITLTRRYKTEHAIKYWQESKEIVLIGNEKILKIGEKYTSEILAIARSRNISFVLWQELSVKIEWE